MSQVFGFVRTKTTMHGSIGPLGDHTFYPYSFFSDEMIVILLNSYEDRLQKSISEKISEIEAVERVYCKREEHTYFVWIVINRLDPSIRRAIYQKQREIIRLFRDEIFDFYVVARLDRPLNSLIGEESVELIFERSE